MTFTGMRGLPTRAVVCSLAATCLLGCGHSRATPQPVPMPVGYNPTEVVVTSAAVTSRGRTITATTAQPTRQLIRRGRMAVEVSGLETARQRLEQSASALGGQVSRATV